MLRLFLWFWRNIIIGPEPKKLPAPPASCPRCTSRGYVRKAAAYCENGLCAECCEPGYARPGCECLAALQSQTREARKTVEEALLSQPAIFKRPGLTGQGKA